MFVFSTFTAIVPIVTKKIANIVVFALIHKLEVAGAKLIITLIIYRSKEGKNLTYHSRSSRAQTSDPQIRDSQSYAPQNLKT